MLSFGTLAKKVFGTPNDRRVKATRPLVEKINALEPEFRKLTDDEIRARTHALAARAQGGESLDALLPEAFANCREAARRALGLRAFDVQLMGGIFMHQGNIAEMKTGEGKTLVATFPAYLNALAGKGVHIVTVNDYLVKRDAEWMGKVYAQLGMTTGAVYPQQPDAEKRAAYQADITYATNNELGFDYLRDNMKSELKDMMQRGHAFAIVDEVDSILIDEARTPLIISGPSDDKSELYRTVDKLIPLLTEAHYTIDEKQRQATFTEEGNEFLESLVHEKGVVPAGHSLYDPESITVVHHLNQGLRAHKLFNRDKEYIVRNGEVVLIDEFTGRMMTGRRLSDGLHQAIEAKEGVAIQAENVTLASITFQNYFRLYQKLAGMTGTALTEADEFQEIYKLGVVEVPTNRPIARIDEHDRVYRTAAEKFEAIVIEIARQHETGQPILVGTTSIEKSEELSQLLGRNALMALARRLETRASELEAKGGKAAAEAAIPREEAALLTRMAATGPDGIAHNVLNARHHEQEAQIVAEAGRPGSVTIATNMAGRGTDIQLGGNVEMQVLAELKASPEADPDALRTRLEATHAEEKARVMAAGGLFVLATERHESRRIDNQLRGRSGRQGDPGRSTFYLSLEDDLMRIFGSDRLDKVLSSLGMREGEAIVHPWVNKSLERAQGKVEARNFDIRKNILKFDDVMNEQRKVIFSQRRDIMEDADLSDVVGDMRTQVVEDLVNAFLPPRAYADQWEAEGLKAALAEKLMLDLPVPDWAHEDGVDQEVVRKRIEEAADALMAGKEQDFGPETMRQIEKQVLLQTLDGKWREHLLMLEHLRSVIQFRGYAQRDPLNEYKAESFELFETMLESLREAVTHRLAAIRPITKEEQEAMLRQMLESQMAARRAQRQATTPARVPELAGAGAAAAGAARPGFDAADPATWGDPGRNDPCPCGSGKKFKHCHGAF